MTRSSQALKVDRIDTGETTIDEPCTEEWLHVMRMDAYGSAPFHQKSNRIVVAVQELRSVYGQEVGIVSGSHMSGRRAGPTRSANERSQAESSLALAVGID
jgi:hypothetical protein